jgi:prepilin-type processing-associated H-X9-DG protein
MKQIALGMLQYAEDYDGRLFFYSSISSENNPSMLSGVLPYIKSAQIFRCPSSGLQGTNTVTATTVPANGTEYGLPATTTAGYKSIVDGVTGTGVLLGEVPEASLYCLLAETVKAQNSSGEKRGFDRFRSFSLDSNSLVGVLAGFSTGTGTTDSRHFEGNNYAFVDGHVKWLKKETVAVPAASNNAIKFWW